MSRFGNIQGKIMAMAEEKEMAREYFFGILDADKDGKIRKLEFDNSKEYKSKIEKIKRMDSNKDGEVTIEEMWAVVKEKMGFECTKEEDQLIDEASKQYFRLREFFRWAADDRFMITLADCRRKQRAIKEGAVIKHKEEYLTQLGQLQNQFSRIDTDQNSQLHLHELWKFVFDVTFPDVETELKMLKFFNAADANGNGKLCDREVQRVLMEMQGPELALKVLETMTPGPDGISIPEFMNSWKRETRDQKFPVTGKRGMQHTEDDLTEIAARRGQLIHVHKTRTNPREIQRRPQDFAGFLRDFDLNEDGIVSFDEYWNTFMKEHGIELTLEENQVVITMSMSYHRLHETFVWIDTDNDDKLTMGECFEKFPVDENTTDDETIKNIVNIFYRIDAGEKDGYLTFPELWDFFRKVEFPDITKEIQMLQFFHDADQNGDGVLAEYECKAAMRQDSAGKKVLEEAIRQGMAWHDGVIDIEEFMGTWKGMLRDQKYPRRH